MKKALLRIACVACVFPLLAGCGEKPTGNLSGSVTYKGKPVVFGSVTVYDAQSRAFQGTIAEGRYQVANITEGPVTITIVSSNPNQGPSNAPPAGGRGGKTDGKGDGKDGGGAPPATSAPVAGWFPLPKKYEDAATTTLKTTVKAGQNPYDLTLTD